MIIKREPERITIKGYKRDDCTILAIGNALGVSYDLARKVLQTAGIISDGRLTFRRRDPRTKYQFTRQRVVHSICRSISEDVHCYEKSGDGRITLAEFAEANNEGIFIALVDRHLSAVIDGKIVDSWDSSERKMVYGYVIDVDKARHKISSIAEHYRLDSIEHLPGLEKDFVAS